MTRFTSLLRLREFRRLLHLTLIALGLTSVGIACGTGASAPPIATVAPPAAAAQAPLVAPTATVTPATAVAPAEAPASVFQFPATRTPRPTPTPIPRAEGDMTAATLYNHRATLLEDGRVLVTGGHAATTPFAYILAGVKSSEIYDPGYWALVADPPLVRGTQKSRCGPSRGRERAGLRRVDRWV